MRAQSFRRVQLFVTVTHQAPLSMGFSRQEYWSGLPFPPSGDFLDPGIESGPCFSLTESSPRSFLCSFSSLILEYFIHCFQISFKVKSVFCPSSYQVFSGSCVPSHFWTLSVFYLSQMTLLVLCIDPFSHFHWTLGSLRAEPSFNHYSIIICTFYRSLIKCHCSVKARFNSVEKNLLMICKMTKYIT